MASETFIMGMGEFLEELIKAFPEEEEIKKYYENFKLQKEKENGAKNILTNFANSVKDKANMITNKDERFFANDVIVDLPLSKIWKCEENDNETKQVIWRHLNNLYLLSSMISSVPPNMMNAIESLAQQCAQEMSSGSDPSAMNSMPDIGNLFAGLQNIMGSQMGQMAQRSAQQSAQQSTSRPSSANPKKKRNKK